VSKVTFFWLIIMTFLTFLFLFQVSGATPDIRSILFYALLYYFSEPSRSICMVFVLFFCVFLVFYVN
jgi:hypothetical protein